VAVQQAIFQIINEPLRWPSLLPIPAEDPLPGACERYLPADGVTIWYVVMPHEGVETTSIQHVRVDAYATAAPAGGCERSRRSLTVHCGAPKGNRTPTF
jgi:hypothetical protein